MTLLPSKAHGENSLCSQHLHFGMLQATASPLLQKSASGYNFKGLIKSSSSTKLQSSHSNETNKHVRKCTGQYVTAKTSVKLKNEGTQRLKDLSGKKKRENISARTISNFISCLHANTSRTALMPQKQTAYIRDSREARKKEKYCCALKEKRTSNSCCSLNKIS